MKKIIALTAILLLSGCVSIDEHSKGCYYKYYQGTERAVAAGYWAYLPWIDVPFSAVADTLTLPVDAICIANK